MASQVLRTFCAAALLTLGFSTAASSAGDFRSLGNVGVGTQSHRFVLRDPLTGAPMPRARYRLFLKNQKIPDTPTDDGIIWGISDSRGHTATVRLPKHYAWAEWVLVPVQGHGESGTFFSITSTEGEVLSGLPYIVSLKGSYLFCGKTSSRGMTDYFMGGPDIPVSLYTNASALSSKDYAWCKREAETIASLPAPAGPATVFRTLLANYETSKNELSSGLLEQVRASLLELAIAGRNDQQFEIALSLGAIDNNNVGYNLVDANWMVERGMGLIEQALALKPDDPSTLDSKGWALFRLNQAELALTYLDRAIAAFGAGSEDNLIERSIGLVHRGEVLWHLGRQEQARLDFAAAQKLAAEDKTLSETLARLHIDIDGDGDR
jgi:hypothetical protein